jgi:hypothetical protein
LTICCNTTRTSVLGIPNTYSDESLSIQASDILKVLNTYRVVWL